MGKFLIAVFVILAIMSSVITYTNADREAAAVDKLKDIIFEQDKCTVAYGLNKDDPLQAKLLRERANELADEYAAKLPQVVVLYGHHVYNDYDLPKELYRYPEGTWP